MMAITHPIIIMPRYLPYLVNLDPQNEPQQQQQPRPSREDSADDF